MPWLFDDTIDDVLLYERVESFRGGMDAFTRSVLLPPDVSRLMQNCIVRDNNLAETRMGADALGGGVIEAGVSENQIVQGLAYYDTPTIEQVVAVCNEKFYKWNGTVWATIAGFTIGSAATDVTMEQGVDKLFISDGVQNWRSYDGTAFTDLGNINAGTNGSPPVGAQIMRWHTNRMFAAGRTNAFRDTIDVSDILDASNGHWNYVNNSFRVGAGEGEPIRGLASLQQNWLGVLKENSVHLVLADPTQTPANWLIQHLTTGIGCVGKRAYCVYGNDLMFIAQDGIRSLRRMQAATDQFEVSAPLSEPMQPYIDRINWSAASKSCAVKYFQYALFAVPLDTATEPNYVLVWNGRTQSWNGFWIGWTPKCWAVSRFSDQNRLLYGSNDGKVNQWKDHEDVGLESTYRDNGVDIATQLDTRSFNYGEPISNKDPYYFEVRFQVADTQANITLFCDDAAIQTYEFTLTQSGANLPIQLPFFLVPDLPETARQALDGVNPFNEAYLSIATTAKRIQVKNISLAAFLNTITNE